MKNEKAILISIIVMICIIIVGITIVVGVIYRINKDNNIEEDISNLEEGGEEYSKEHLKDLDFEVTNLNSNIKSKIKDINKFLLDMKEYIYLNGFVQANIAECININEEENKMILQFRLNNPEKTIVLVNINLKDNTYEFSDNYVAN